MKNQSLKITFRIEEDTFPLQRNVKEYAEHCVTYLIHNNTQIYIGETSHLKSRFKDHAKSKEKFKLLKTKIIASDYFNKSAVYDIESRLINYIYADGQFELLNIKKEQASHNYYLKNEINDQLFKNIWKALQDKKVVKQDIFELENNHLFKYSPFKEFSQNQLEIIDEIINLVSSPSEQKKIGFDGSTINIHEIRKTATKTLVNGGPGTGKTLLIVKLVHDLARKYDIDPKKIYVCIPQSNLLKTFQKMFRQTKLKINLIRPIEISKVPDSAMDLLIVDEAHRLKKYFSKQSKDLKHLDNGNIDEFDLAVRKSKHLVLMYDSGQSIRPADVNPSKFQQYKFDKKLYLHQQYRVKAGADYLEFISQLLQIKPGYPDVTILGDYEIKVFESVQDLRTQIQIKDSKFGLARMSSGYFLEWISKKNPRLHDFEKIGLKMKWNTTFSGWARSEDAINEVGCIHTLQGEDLNYNGVIFGDEIYLDPTDNLIKIRKENYKDVVGTPVKLTDTGDIQLTNYIKNIYYVLLTRGMLGTYIYIQDKNLRDYFKMILKRPKN